MWDLEDRLRGALALAADDVYPAPGLTEVRLATTCVHHVQAVLAIRLGVEFGPAYAALGLAYWAGALAERGRPHLAEFVRGTADLLTPDSERPSASPAEGPTSPATPGDTT